MPLTKDEILSLLGYIENERVERTLATDNTKKMSETICAFAMNAVMHRAYNGYNSPIKFYEYCDRIEIENPGNLYGKVNLVEENKTNHAEFLLGDYTTFKVVVQNADVIENDTNVTERTPNVIVNATESGTDGTNSDTNGTMRNNNGKIAEQSGIISGTIGETIRNNPKQSGTI